jgi:hypothetical protein
LKGGFNMDYYEETLNMIEERKNYIAEKFKTECIRLLKSGAVDKENHSRGLLFGVAIENIADGYLRGERKTKNYKNLRCF